MSIGSASWTAGTAGPPSAADTASTCAAANPAYFHTARTARSAVTVAINTARRRPGRAASAGLSMAMPAAKLTTMTPIRPRTNEPPPKAYNPRLADETRPLRKRPGSAQ